ncbi:unnamed protein product [marine sediment metagenome]|uniref:Uncharacterized protein n=1 Tax=marine sediment metagenome TaxID=412755 RepID=X1DF75_9ZZZZ
MPTWQIHNKWAKEASISQETSNFVNLLIALPQKHQEKSKGILREFQRI